MAQEWRVEPSDIGRIHAQIDCHCERGCAHLGRVAGRRQQGTVKIGLIMPYSGQFADTATQMDNAIKLYMKQNGDTVAGKKIEIIRKDSAASPPTSPSASRRN